jgi:hypothetical protein
MVDKFLQRAAAIAGILAVIVGLLAWLFPQQPASPLPPTSTPTATSMNTPIPTLTPTATSMNTPIPTLTSAPSTTPTQTDMTTLTLSDTPVPTRASTATAIADSLTSPTLTQGAVTITNIVNAGDVTAEGVEIRNNGELVDLAGWTLTDADGNVFTFPNLFLFTGGVEMVYTRAGSNTPTSLFWSRDTAVWETNDVATLRDENGVVQSTFQVQTSDLP